MKKCRDQFFLLKVNQVSDVASLFAYHRTIDFIIIFTLLVLCGCGVLMNMRFVTIQSIQSINQRLRTCSAYGSDDTNSVCESDFGNILHKIHHTIAAKETRQFHLTSYSRTNEMCSIAFRRLSRLWKTHLVSNVTKRTTKS